MSNALVSRMGNEAAIAAYTSALYGMGASIGSYDGRPILRLTEDGEFVFGENDDFLTEEDVLAVLPTSFQEGWIAFNDKNERAETVDGETADFLFPLGKNMTEDQVYDEHPLEAPKRGRAPEYKHQFACEMMVVAGPNKGTAVVYKPTSTGGRRMMAKLAGEIGRKMERGDEACVPVIELWSKSYHNKRWNREIFNPMAEIVEWYTLDDEELDGEEENTRSARGKDTAKDRGRSSQKEKEAEYDEDDADNARGSRRRERDRDEDTGNDDRNSRSRGNRRGRDETEEQDAPPRRSRRDSPSNSDEDEGEKPARRTRSRRDEEEAGEAKDERPARRSRSRAEDDEMDAPKPAGPRGSGRSRSGRSRR